MDATEAICWLRLLLDEAIKGEKADGVLLSGGLDTSIVALIARRHAKKLKGFTVTLEGFDEDLKYARSDNTYDLEAMTQGSLRESFAPSHQQPDHRLELDIAGSGHHY